MTVATLPKFERDKFGRLFVKNGGLKKVLVREPPEP